MARAAERQHPMTVAEFLVWDSGDELRYELVEGMPVAIDPPVAPHALLLIEVGAALRSRVRPPCRVYGVGGACNDGDDDNYRIPDLTVSCTRSPGHWVEAPRIVVEILSPSTQRYDQTLKLVFYRSLPTLEEILLIRADRRHVEHWRRESDAWTVRDLIGSAAIDLKLLTEPIPLDEIYASLELDEADAAAP